MAEQNISPSTVTKPIQLLAAWLVGLLSLNGSFLLTATNIKHPDWASGFLVICSAINVPIFLFCLFMLQTRFRPEMQEDQFYSKYIEKKYSFETGKTEIVEIDAKVSARSMDQKVDLLIESGISSRVEIAVNDLLKEYPAIVQELISGGFRITETFGSTSEPPERPDRFAVSVSRDVPPDIFKGVIDIVGKFGLEVITSTNLKLIENTIYIGSYAYDSKNRRHFEYNKDLKNRIDNGLVTPEVLHITLNGLDSET